MSGSGPRRGGFVDSRLSGGPSLVKRGQQAEFARAVPCAALLLVLCVVNSPGAAQRSTADLAAATSAMSAGVTAAKAGNLPEALADFRRAVKLAHRSPLDMRPWVGCCCLWDRLRRRRRSWSLPTAWRPKMSWLIWTWPMQKPQWATMRRQRGCLEPRWGARRRPSFQPRIRLPTQPRWRQWGYSGRGSCAPQSGDRDAWFGGIIWRAGYGAGKARGHRGGLLAIPAGDWLRSFAVAGTVSPGRGTAGHEWTGRRDRTAAGGSGSRSAQPGETAAVGTALSSLHEDAKALAALHQAAELRTPTTNPDALYALAIALQASGDAKGALPLFRRPSAPTRPMGRRVVRSSRTMRWRGYRRAMRRGRSRFTRKRWRSVRIRRHCARITAWPTCNSRTWTMRWSSSGRD